jgi:hypothetical protein
MTQRILVACCVLLVLVSFGMAVLLWTQTQQSRATAEKYRAMLARQMAEIQEAQQALAAKQLADSRSSQQEMLKQLKELSSSVSRSRAPEWIPVKFKLTEERENGPPAVGVIARLGKGSGGSRKDEAIVRVSDSQGLIDFGVVQPGDWEFQLERAVDEIGAWNLRGQINTVPAMTIDKRIVCPPISKEPARVSVRMTPPEALVKRDQAPCVLASFVHRGQTYQPLLQWNFHPAFSKGRTSFSFLDGPHLERRGLVEFGLVQFWRLGDLSRYPGYEAKASKDEVAASKGDERSKLGPVHVDVAANDLKQMPGEIDVVPGTYQLQRLVLVRPIAGQAAGDKRDRFEFISMAESPGSVRGVWILPPAQLDVFRVAPSDSGKQTEPPLGSGPMPNTLSKPIDVEFWSETVGHFEARSGETREWTVPLPESLLETVQRDR